MSKLASSKAVLWARRWSALGAIALAFAACDLNPQPEVPSGAAGSGGVAATGGKGGSGGGIGVGGSGGMAGGGAGDGGGSGFGGAGGASGDASTEKCQPGCGSGELCNSGQCVDDPCAPNSCSADKACKPNADFTAASCLPSCAGVTCGAGESCVDGQCKATGCGAPCGAGDVCAPDGDGGFECVPDLCAGDAPVACALGEACEPSTGACAADPCNGVKCPTGQLCAAGQCDFAGDASAGDAGSLDASAD